MSRSIHVAVNGITSFLLWLIIFHCIYMYRIFFIHSFVNGHLGYFRILAIVNSAAMNTEVHVSFRSMVCSGCMPRSGISGSYGSFIFFFKEPPIVFSLVAVTIYILTNGIGWFPFLHTLMCFLAIYISSLEKCLVTYFAHFIFFLFFDTKLHELFVYFGN